MASASTSTVDQVGDRTISAVHPDIIQTHILTLLDGPTLASAGCASSYLHALSTQDKLWRDICTSTWPSIQDPRVQHLISTFPSGHRSFFSDSFPLLEHRSSSSSSSQFNPSPTFELISAVDVFYGERLIFSKVQETETVTGWFECSPFRVDLLDPKESVPTQIRYGADDQEEAWLRHLEENLKLSWIMIDPTRRRAANLSSRKPVSVQRQWLTGDVQLRYATIMADGDEAVECAMVVTFAGKEGGKLQVIREVSLVVEDVDGKHLSGRNSLGILKTAIEGGKMMMKMKKKKELRREGKERFEEFLEMKRKRREKQEMKERALDMACILTGLSFFAAFWTFILFR